MKSELGLGFQEEDRNDRRSKKKKKHQQHRKYHSKSTDLDRNAHFASSTSKENQSSNSKDIRKVSIQEQEEEDKEKTLISENYSATYAVSGMEEDLEHEEQIYEDEEEFFGQLNHSCTHSPTGKYGNQRINSEIHHLAMSKHRFPRTTSLDLNSHNAAMLSPQFLVGGIANLKKSPWTPNYQKGWSSERVPLQTNGRQRYKNVKPLPSKWEDAERWIGSPVSIDGNGRLVLPSYYRRPKSKSGPLGPPSPLVPCFDSGRVVNMAANSPFMAGVLVGDPQCFGSARRGNGSFVSENVESYLAQQSAAVNGWSESSSQTTTQGEKLDSKEGSMMCSPKVMLKDVATQMSPESIHSSPNKRSPSSVPQLADPIVDVEAHFSKLEIRDVEVDHQFTMTRLQKKHVTSERCLRNIIEWKNKTGEDNASAYDVADPSKFLSKDNSDEGKIGAWKNFQEAKAGEAIRKLEMKLEKERSSSMDKILNKLRSAQKKAEDMRSAMRSGQSRQNRTSKKASFFNRFGHRSFLRSCFTYHAS